MHLFKKLFRTLPVTAFLFIASTKATAGSVGGAVTQAQALQMIKDGNARFVAGKPEHPNSDIKRVLETAAGQHPFATIITCADSRIPVERVLDRGVGDIFTIRVAGNVSDTDEIGTAEYGVGHLRTPLLVVMGHTKCGAIKAVCDGAQVHGSIPALVDNIVPAVKDAKTKFPNASGEELVSEAVKLNVWQSISDLVRHSAEIRKLISADKLTVVGAVYDISTGKVEWLGPHPEQAVLLKSTADGGRATSDHGALAPNGHGKPAAGAEPK